MKASTRRSLRFAFLLASLTPLAALSDTISTGSRQFRVETASALLGRRASHSAEAIRANVYAILGQRSHFLTPISVRFEEERLGDDLDDFEFRVDVRMGLKGWEYSVIGARESPESARVLDWNEAVVAALQYEMSNRVPGENQRALGSWPPWLNWAMCALADAGAIRQTEKAWETRFRRKTYRKLSQIWEAPASQSGQEKEKTQVLGALLVLRLQELPQGRSKLARLANAACRGKFSAAEFQRIYAADFPDGREAEKWWTAQQAIPRRGVEPASLDLQETVLRAREWMEGGLPEPGIEGLSQEHLDELNELQRQFLQLMVAGHPMARPALETAIGALENARHNQMKSARPSWSNTATILEALSPWKSEIDGVLDRQEYLADQLTTRRWLARKRSE